MHPEILDRLPWSKNASYDPAIQCLEGTRVDVLNQIDNWINSREPGNNLFWLRGVAGSGKTAIASTVAAHLDSNPSPSSRAILGATFFCKRDDSALNDPLRIFPTI